MPSRPPRPGGRYKELTPKHIGELHPISGDKITFEFFGKRVGELQFKGAKLHFKGDADKSAKFLFDRLKDFVEHYIQERLQAGQEKTKCQSTK